MRVRILIQLPQQRGDGLQVVKAGVAGGSLASSTWTASLASPNSASTVTTNGWPGLAWSAARLARDGPRCRPSPRLASPAAGRRTLWVVAAGVAALMDVVANLVANHGAPLSSSAAHFTTGVTFSGDACGGLRSGRYPTATSRRSVAGGGLAAGSVMTVWPWWAPPVRNSQL
jgi:hypothetical protein